MSWQKIKDKVLDRIVEAAIALVVFLCGAIYLAVPPATWEQIGAATPKRALAAVAGLLLIAFLISLAYIYSRRRTVRQNQEAVATHLEKIQTLTARVAELSSQTQQLDIEKRRLAKQVQELTHDVLDETGKNILVLLSRAGKRGSNAPHMLASQLQLHPERVLYYLEELEQLKYIEVHIMATHGGTYFLSQKGRDFLIKNGLI